MVEPMVRQCSAIKLAIRLPRLKFAIVKRLEQQVKDLLGLDDQQPAEIHRCAIALPGLGMALLIYDALILALTQVAHTAVLVGLAVGDRAVLGVDDKGGK